MADHKFDIASKALALSISRRQAVKGFATAAGVAVFSLIGIGEAEAAPGCKPGGSYCEGTVRLGCLGNKTCQCQVTTEGTTVCTSGFALPGGSTCGECTSSAQCAQLHPGVPGVVCVAPSETGCCAPSISGGGGYCIAPCK